MEKTIKSCIREKKVIPKKSHDLAGLCSTAVAAGVPAVDPALISAVQCSASVRYDCALVSKNLAVEANYAALKICGALAWVVKRTDGQSDVFEYEFHTAGGPIPGLLLGHSSARPPFSGSTAPGKAP